MTLLTHIRHSSVTPECLVVRILTQTCNLGGGQEIEHDLEGSEESEFKKYVTSNTVVSTLATPAQSE